MCITRKTRSKRSTRTTRMEVAPGTCSRMRGELRREKGWVSDGSTSDREVGRLYAAYHQVDERRKDGSGVYNAEEGGGVREGRGSDGEAQEILAHERRGEGVLRDPEGLAEAMPQLRDALEHDREHRDEDGEQEEEVEGGAGGGVGLEDEGAERTTHRLARRRGGEAGGGGQPARGGEGGVGGGHLLVERHREALTTGKRSNLTWHYW